jgi:hypothetical protein
MGSNLGAVNVHNETTATLRENTMLVCEIRCVNDIYAVPRY